MLNCHAQQHSITAADRFNQVRVRHMKGKGRERGDARACELLSFATLAETNVLAHVGELW